MSVKHKNPHTFYIPVMGTGFTIDAPIKVAKYGISSVISLVDDILIEQMRKYHSDLHGEQYSKLTNDQEDVRARRITEYLNLVNLIVEKQAKELQSSPFEEGSEITRYYEMLPDSSLKQLYSDMLKTDNFEKKCEIQEKLRDRAIPGRIDVNIMATMDRDIYRDGKKMSPEYRDAMSALRGYAKSSLCSSSIVFSAGFNPRLYGYIAEFDDFYPDINGHIKKKVILKVSEFRSALIQGKFLAKKGIWVSEYRIESGLNCGGHAFASDGYLLGPVLEEFKNKRHELVDSVYSVYKKALEAKDKGLHGNDNMVPDMAVTVQGGIKTAVENDFLLKYYKVDATGWGTPFLLVPEVTCVDDESLQKLLAADEKDVFLSNASPLRIPFWNLHSAPSEENRIRRIKENKPGSPCPKSYSAFNLDFTDTPICIASRAYVNRKLKALETENISESQRSSLIQDVLDKACLCHDLAGGVTREYGIDPNAKPAICCGPNIALFSKIVSLEEMIGHIYGRLSISSELDFPHMFIRELMLYVEYLINELEKLSLEISTKTQDYFNKFRENLLSGIDYYKRLAGQFIEKHQDHFLADLRKLRDEVERICLVKDDKNLCV
ncbi:MAG: hypothetical protein P9M03_04045 [Candidatus Theseobacter exili]|nr:hypothetical protein [Candidatus Theseobacter exili]